MENCSDDGGAGGEAARPRIAQRLVNCGGDDDDRMVERLPRIVAPDDGDGNDRPLTPLDNRVASAGNADGHWGSILVL